MANLLSLGDELKKLFSKAGSFIQQNPTPAGFLAKQLPQQIRQPIEQNLGRLRNVDIASTAAGGAMKAYNDTRQMSPFSPQRMVAQNFPIVGAAQNIFSKKPTFASEQIQRAVPGKAGALLGFGTEMLLPGIGGELKAAQGIKGLVKSVAKQAPRSIISGAGEATNLNQIPQYAGTNIALSAGLSAISPIVSKLNPNAKGMVFGKNRNTGWSLDESRVLSDSLADLHDNAQKLGKLVVRGEKPKYPYEYLKSRELLTSIEERLGSLADNHIPNDTLKRLAKDYGSNSVGYLKALGEELQNSIKNHEDKKGILLGIYGGPKAKGFKNDGSFSSMADKKVRFEIDDSGAKLKTTDKWLDALNGNPVDVGSLLDHPSLYKQYPELKDNLIVKFGDIGSSKGQVSSEGGVTFVTLNKNLFGKNFDTEGKSTLLHEIQHAIQEKEGFARGGSPASAKSLSDTNSEQRSLRSLKEELMSVAQKTGDTDLLASGFTQSKNPAIQNKLKEVMRLEKIINETPLESYLRLSGEVEARDVQSRMNLSPEQRATTLPYKSQGIPVKDQIVRFEGGTQANIPNGFIDADGTYIDVDTHAEAALKMLNNPSVKNKDEALIELMQRGIDPRDKGFVRSVIKPKEVNYELIGNPNPQQLKTMVQNAGGKKIFIDITDQNGKVIQSHEFDSPEGLQMYFSTNNTQVSIAPQKTTLGITPPVKTPGEIKQSIPAISSNAVNPSNLGTNKPTLQQQLPQGKTGQAGPQLNQPPSGKVLSPDEIISEARKNIKPTVEKTTTIRQAWKRFYTDNVNRFQPVEDIVNEVEKKTQSVIRPEFSPKTQIMRLLGAGGTAELRHRKVLDPILKSIPKEQLTDFDVYLKARRDVGFGTVGREVFGSDPVKSQQVIDAMGTKYDLQQWEQTAKKLYDYQDQNLQRLVDEGFIDPTTFNAIKGQNPDYVPFQRVMDDVDSYIGLPTKRLSQGPNPVKKIEGSERAVLSPIESIIADTYKMEAAVAKNRVAKSIGQLSQILPDIKIKKVSQSSANTIPVWEGGKKVFYEVPEDINRVVKGLNEEQQTQVVKYLSIPAQWLRQGATGRNIDFMVPNIIKDQFDAAVNSKYGYVPFTDYFSGLAELIKYKMGKPSLYEDWANSGGKIFYEMAGGRKAIAEEISDATTQKNIGKKFIGAIINGLDLMGEFSETPTRLGLFKKAYEATGNKFLAAGESREGTLDFARMGAKMKTLNAIIPFFNVGIQGFDKLIRTAKEQPGKMLFYGGIYGIAPQIALTIYNNTYHPEEYKEIPDEIKQDNFVFVSGRSPEGRVLYKTLAKGNTLPYITNPIDNLLSAAAGYDRKKFSELALSLLGEALPIIESGRDLGQAASRTLGGVIPQAFKPAIEDVANYNFYKGKEIVPWYMKQKAPIDQAYEDTELPYKYVGNLLQVSPLRVKNFIEGTFAGTVKTPLQLLSIAQKISRGETPSANEIPVLRRFMSETYDTNEQYQEKKQKQEDKALDKQEQDAQIAPFEKRLLLGEVSAAEKVDLKSREKLKKSKETKLKENGKIFIKSETESGVRIDTIDPKFQPTPPKFTGKEDLDKEVREKFNGEITQKANDIYKLFKEDEITQDEANTQLAELKDLKEKYAIPKKPKKGKKLAKISFKKVTVKPVKFVTSKRTKMTNIKFKKPPKPRTLKLKGSKAVQAIRLKPIQAKKLKGLEASTRLV